jgi:tellurite resistance-related uncharacterized protein
MAAYIPRGFVAYKRTPILDQDTVPPGLLRRHSTKANVWAVIHVVEGLLTYRTLEPMTEVTLDADHRGVIQAGQPHEVEPQGAVRFFIEFYRHPGLSQDAVIELLQRLQSERSATLAADVADVSGIQDAAAALTPGDEDPQSD